MPFLPNLSVEIARLRALRNDIEFAVPPVHGVDVQLLLDRATQHVETFALTGYVSPAERGELRAIMTDLMVVNDALPRPVAAYVRALGTLAAQVLDRRSDPFG